MIRREIKFRGMDKIIGIWRYGSLVLRERGPNIYWEDEDNTYGYYVKPETVGQFTDLKDKNEVKIWEGDIVKRKDGLIGEVIFNEGCFVFKTLQPGPSIQNLYDKCFEVIGNIHQNSYLLDIKESENENPKPR